VNAGTGALAKVKDPKLSVPSAGASDGRSGRGTGNSRSGEEDSVRLSGLPELLANLAQSAADPRNGNSRSGDEDSVRLSGLPELLANLAQSTADPEGSVGGVEKKPWSLWQSSTVCAPLQRRPRGHLAALCDVWQCSESDRRTAHWKWASRRG
jgi:hypothetical protein